MQSVAGPKKWLSIGVLAALWVAVPGGVAAAKERRSFALIIANNQSYDGHRAPLRFADDDGVRFAELFATEGDRVDLLTVLDTDTQRIFPEFVERTTPPRRQAVLDALDNIFAEIAAENATGKETVFYFVFSGHGDVDDDGTGFVHLLDGRLTRHDLFQQVIAASPAATNHIIIDACNAYFMVSGRGSQATPSRDYSALVRSMLGKQRLAAYPNTGVLLATASAAETHEWGRVEAGVFSHELRSALAGAADANADGSITYTEVAAFLAAANGAVADAKARIHAFTRAPAQNLDEPLARLPDNGATVILPTTWSGRYFLEDDRGVRFADLHKSAEMAVRLRLVPRPRYYVRSDRLEYVVDPADQASGEHLLASISGHSPLLAARGSVNDTFAKSLFAIPFGPQFVAGFSQASLDDQDPMQATAELPQAESFGYWPLAAAGLAATAGAAAGILEMQARSNAEIYRNTAGNGQNLQALRDDAISENTAARVLGGVAIGAALTAATLYIIDWLDGDEPAAATSY